MVSLDDGIGLGRHSGNQRKSFLAGVSVRTGQRKLG